MISKERTWPYKQPRQTQACDDSPSSQPRPDIKEDTIKSAEIQVERKKFILTLKENVRGRLL
jgi:hypothetical protein